MVWVRIEVPNWEGIESAERSSFFRADNRAGADHRALSLGGAGRRDQVVIHATDFVLVSSPGMTALSQEASQHLSQAVRRPKKQKGQ